MGRKTSSPSGAFVIDCSETRYHVVRTAAASLGWTIEDGARAQSVPVCFHGVDIASHRRHTPSCPGNEDSSPSMERSLGPRRPPHIVWVDKSVIAARLKELSSLQQLNHFIGMNCVARKAVLFKRLMRIRKLTERGTAVRRSKSAVQEDVSAAGDERALAMDTSLREAIDAFYPASFSSLSDVGVLHQYVEQLSSAPAMTAHFFIVKPNKGSEGRGIRLTRDPLAALTPAEMRDPELECLVQAYVDRPLLIDGKKFDIRLYVLVTSVAAARPARRATWAAAAAAAHTAATAAAGAVEEGPTDAAAAADCVPLPLEGIRLYIHEEGLVRMCAAPYEAPTEANQGRGGVHITNYAVNKREEGYHVDRRTCEEGVDTPKGLDTGNKRDLVFLRHYIDELAKEGAPVPGRVGRGWEAVWRRIGECVALTFLSGASKLRREWLGAMGSRVAREDCRSSFELLGFDIMLHADTLAPVLMEVNHSPSLFCETEFDFAVKQRVLRDVLTLVTADLALPKARRHTGVSALSSPCSQAGAEAALVERGGVGFSQLLPHYLPSGGQSVADWTADERERQVRMMELGNEVP